MTIWSRIEGTVTKNMKGLKGWYMKGDSKLGHVYIFRNDCVQLQNTASTVHTLYFACLWKHFSWLSDYVIAQCVHVLSHCTAAARHYFLLLLYSPLFTWEFRTSEYKIAEATCSKYCFTMSYSNKWMSVSYQSGTHYFSL